MSTEILSQCLANQWLAELSDARDEMNDLEEAFDELLEATA